MLEFLPLLIYFTLALLASFLCSLLEASLLSMPQSHVERTRESGSRTGKILAGLKSKLDRPLAAILTLNTLAHTGGAAGVGAETTKIAARRGLDEALWTGIAAVIVTILVLVFSEIIPKTIGAVYWRGLTPFTAYSVRFLIWTMYPVVRMLELISRLFYPKNFQEGVTREEMRVMAQLASASGSLQQNEGRVITNLFALHDVQARDVMTPRVEVFTLPESMTAEQVARKHKRLRFSRIPVYSESPDTITGLVLRHRIFEMCVQGQGSKTLGDLKNSVHFVPETKTIASLLDEFIKRSDHLFIVVNEFGSPEGIVTLEDAIETLLGVEIVDEYDSVEDLRLAARQKMEQRKERIRMLDEQEAKSATTEEPDLEDPAV